MMLEKEFYDTFIADKNLYNLLSYIFSEDQLKIYLNKLEEHHSKNLSSLDDDELANFLIEMNIEMKCNILENLWNGFFS